jgi:hypothetical protein
MFPGELEIMGGGFTIRLKFQVQVMEMEMEMGDETINKHGNGDP